MKYDCNNAAVIRELGYPDRKTLNKWVKEFNENGTLKVKSSRKSKYSKMIEKERLIIFLNMVVLFLKQFKLLDILIAIPYLYG